MIHGITNFYNNKVQIVQFI